MPFDFDTVIERRGSGSAKYDYIAQKGYPEDTLPMWIADMDFQTAPCVTEALKKQAEHGIYGYGFPSDRYFKAVQGWFSKRFGWEIQREWMAFSPGVVFALSTAVRVTTQPGEAVLITPPVYYPFYNVIRNNGRTLVESQLLYEDGRYRVDFADFEEKIVDNNVKLFILCSPHNPICRVWSREELVRMGEICRRHGVKVVSDEIHCDFTWPGVTHTPFLLACPDMAGQAIVCTAPSKTFNLAGLQTSNIIIPGTELREAWLQEMTRINYHHPGNPGLAACQAAYEGGAPWLDACIEYMHGNLCYMRRFLEENIPQIKLVEPEGTYFAWLDCSALGLTPEALDALMLQKAHLWLDGGSMFGSCSGQFQRVVLACPRKIVAEALDRLKDAVSQL